MLRFQLTLINLCNLLCNLSFACTIFRKIPDIMPENTVDLARETASKVDQILDLLKGNEFSPGLISLVQLHEREIELLKADSSNSRVSTSTLVGVAYLGLFLVPVLTVFDRMILISEVRQMLGFYGWTAVAISLCLGLLAKTFLIFVVVVFVLRWIGWGRHC